MGEEEIMIIKIMIEMKEGERIVSMRVMIGMSICIGV
jgi:hypothetical protein